MNTRSSGWVVVSISVAALGCADDPGIGVHESSAKTFAPAFVWRTVVNNGTVVPGDARTFNSYNQPSVNTQEVVVFRARSRGGTSGEPAHGVWARDMATGSLTTIFDRHTPVPHPNNLGATIVEPPSFPRIDIHGGTIASRGNHPPAWQFGAEGEETRVATTGIYVRRSGLITGASNAGAAPGFEHFAVPGSTPPRKFDVFPGAPAVTGTTIAFKANFTVDAGHKTGVYYREVADAPAGGSGPVIPIADSDTPIPGSATTFGSTAPPSAAGGQIVFTGLDVEEAPTLGGIYRAPLAGARPTLTPLVTIGSPVPGVAGAVFNKLGEGLSFDGRFVAFWGAWGTATRSLTLQCPTEGNQARVAFCLATYPDGFTTSVPVNQGIFVHDTRLRKTFAIAKAPADFDDFVYWNFSGSVPGMSHAEEDGEPARWRFSAFAAVSGFVADGLSDPTYHAAFKATKGTTTGIYLRRGPGVTPLAAVVETGMAATDVDPDAVGVDEETGEPIDLFVTEMGIERDGFRGNVLAVSVGMGTEDAGWAGIYVTTVSPGLP